MVDRLTEIYDYRLKALIGYTSTEFTREIAGYMFNHFGIINKHTAQGGYKEVMIESISEILSYTPGRGREASGSAGFSSYQLTMSLENYIRTNVELLYPQWRNDYKDDEYRNVLGDKFVQHVSENKELYPAKMRPSNFFTQLNYTTQYRNKLAHNQDFGGSGIYRRYYILQAYDVILCLLLYTFYYMALNSGYTLQHIND